MIFLSNLWLVLLWGIPASGAFVATTPVGRTLAPLFVATRKAPTATDIGKLSVLEAGLEAQWKALRKVNGDDGRRPTFCIPRESLKGTRSVDSLYANEQDLEAAMDLVPSENNDIRKKYDYGGPLTIAVDEATVALKAMAFVVRESVTSLQTTFVGDEEQGVSKKGVFEIGKTFLESCRSIWPRKNAGRLLESGSSSTRAVGKTTKPQMNPTISLSPDKAYQLWGYTVHQKENKWGKFQSNFGLWQDHVFHSTASTANRFLEHAQVDTSDMVKGVASVLDGALTATCEFQKKLTGICGDMKGPTTSLLLSEGKEALREDMQFQSPPPRPPVIVSEEKSNIVGLSGDNLSVILDDDKPNSNGDIEEHKTPVLHSSKPTAFFFARGDNMPSSFAQRPPQNATTNKEPIYFLK